ncbi:MAG: RpiB/LacA/LacB family sugar-phosphate isomerase [Dongiaceae bacterium]
MANQKLRVAVAADNLGFDLKRDIVAHLTAGGYAVTDLGADSDKPVDYPDIGGPAAERVASGEFDRGILICGTGAGMAISANKVPGIRAVCIADPYTAERAKASNDAQIATLGALVTGREVAKKLVDIFLQAEFQGGKSAPKVQKMMDIERRFTR